MKTVKLVFALVCSFVVAGAHGNVAQNFIQNAKNGNLQKVQSYIAKGGNVNVSTKYGTTAMIAASEKGHVEIVEMLISARANVDAGHCVGSALLAASGNGHIDIVKLLIKNGANVNLKPRHGPTPFIAAVMQKDVKMAKVFLEAGADMYMKDSNGVSSYDWAKRNDHSEMIRLLLDTQRKIKAKEAKMSRATRAFRAISNPTGAHFGNLTAVKNARCK